MALELSRRCISFSHPDIKGPPCNSGGLIHPEHLNYPSGSVTPLQVSFLKSWKVNSPFPQLLLWKPSFNEVLIKYELRAPKETMWSVVTNYYTFTRESHDQCWINFAPLRLQNTLLFCLGGGFVLGQQGMEEPLPQPALHSPLKSL